MSFQLPPPPANGQLHRVLPPTRFPADDDYIQELREEIWRLRRYLCDCGKGDWNWPFHDTDCPVRASQP